MRFIRKNGRIIPIREAGEAIRGGAARVLDKHPAASGFGILVGATYAAPKIRKFALKKAGVKNGSLGALSNVAADIGVSAGLIYGAQKFGGSRVTKSLEAMLKILKRSV